MTFARSPDTADTGLDSNHALIAIIAAGTVGEVLLYIVPILLGAIVESFTIREGTAGLVMSLEIGASAAAALILSVTIHRIRCRPVALASMGIVLVGDVVSAIVPSFAFFILARMLAALGAGALFAIASTMAARRRNPEQTFALLSFVVIVSATVGYIAITVAIEKYGPQSAFAALAVLSLAALPFLFWFPNTISAKHSSGIKSLSRERLFLAIAILAAIFIFYIGQNGLWAYVERIGTSLEIPLPVISQILIANGIISLIGPTLAHRLNIKFGRKIPLLLSMLVQILTALTLVYATDLPLYAVSVVVLTTSFMFSLPYLKGLMAAVDPMGRVAGASAALITIGAAAGPGIAGGALNAGATYITIGWFTASAIVVTTILSLIVAQWSDSPGRRHHI